MTVLKDNILTQCHHNNLLVHAAMIAHAPHFRSLNVSKNCVKHICPAIIKKFYSFSQFDVRNSKLDQIIFSVRAKIYSNKALFLFIFIYSSGQRIKRLVYIRDPVLLPCRIRQYTVHYNQAVQVTYISPDNSSPLHKHARM